jgi:hypothetical protein
VRDYPWEFTVLTIKRVSYFWDGSALLYRTRIADYWCPWSFVLLSFLLLPAFLIAHRTRLHAWALFFTALALYPSPYYLTFAHARYRHAVEPIMLLVISYACVQVASKAAARWRERQLAR